MPSFHNAFISIGQPALFLRYAAICFLVNASSRAILQVFIAASEAHNTVELGIGEFRRGWRLYAYIFPEHGIRGRKRRAKMMLDYWHYCRRLRRRHLSHYFRGALIIALHDIDITLEYISPAFISLPLVIFDITPFQYAIVEYRTRAHYYYADCRHVTTRSIIRLRRAAGMVRRATSQQVAATMADIEDYERRRCRQGRGVSIFAA